MPRRSCSDALGGARATRNRDRRVGRRDRRRGRGVDRGQQQRPMPPRSRRRRRGRLDFAASSTASSGPDPSSINAADKLSLFQAANFNRVLAKARAALGPNAKGRELRRVPRLRVDHRRKGRDEVDFYADANGGVDNSGGGSPGGSQAFPLSKIAAGSAAVLVHHIATAAHTPQSQLHYLVVDVDPVSGKMEWLVYAIDARPVRTSRRPGRPAGCSSTAGTARPACRRSPARELAGPEGHPRHGLVPRAVAPQVRAIEDHFRPLEAQLRHRRRDERRAGDPGAAPGPRDRHVAQERPLLGSIPATGPKRRRGRRLKRAEATLEIFERDREHAGAAGWQRHGLGEREHRRAGAAHRLARPRDPAGLRPVAPAEEAQRHVEVAAGDEPQRLAGAEHRGAPFDERIARLARQLERDEQPRALAVHPARRAPASSPTGRPATPSPASSLRTRCIATVVERSRTSARPPGSCAQRVIRGPRARRPRSTRSRRASPRYRRPGPAIPVTPTPKSAPKRSAAPSASASATSVETAPNRSISVASTPASATFAAFEYDDHPAQKYAEEPGARSAAPTSARRCTTRRRRRCARRSSAATCWSTVVPSSENSVSRVADGDERPPRSYTPPPPARSGSTTSISPRRRHVVISSGRARAVRLGGAQRVRDLRLRHAEQPQHPAAVLGGAGGRGLNASVWIAVAHIGWSSRGGPGSTTTVGRALARRHHQPRGGAHRVDHRRAVGDHRLLAVRDSDRLTVEVRPARASTGEDLLDPPLEAGSSSTISRPANSPTTSAVRSSAVGPEPAARDDHRVAAIRKRPEPRRATRRGPVLLLIGLNGYTNFDRCH